MAEGPASPDLVRRHAEALVHEALGDTRVVLVNGARQTGKSTLTRLIADRRHGTVIRLLDDAATRRAAVDDPVDFVDHEAMMVIDEIQLVPELLRAIKVSVDLDPRPGRFLLTGSSRILALRTLPDALPGRKSLNYGLSPRESCTAARIASSTPRSLRGRVSLTHRSCASATIWNGRSPAVSRRLSGEPGDAARPSSTPTSLSSSNGACWNSRALNATGNC
jgi:AAA domain